ncbi:hypothetical protein [Nocardioides pinisoli]|uniref:DUF4333 domain-containing protein n=1 Tax=Nocardioides pinisoli TaxID=2950279 RepID=A0ABT1KRH3_9ACTN|nr:hypothetical protein [Nocardioides pinisoli]MCP3420347.1 hypothetical protein [Nocardioides pinisoli]
MYAATKKKGRDQRLRAAALSIVAALTAAFGPDVIGGVGAFWDRHVVAEARGDTAQAIASKIGWAVYYSPERPSDLTVAPDGTGKCGVQPLPDVEVSCSVKVQILARSDDERNYFVLVEHGDETFTWDSKDVLGPSA